MDVDGVSYDIGNNATDEYEYYYYYYEHEIACLGLQLPDLFCQYPSFVVACWGYIYPFIAVFTAVFNIFSFIIFTRYSYSATWIFLAGITLADIMTALPPTAHYMYLYTFGNFRNIMPFGWCSTYFVAVEFFPLWFHTASIFLTVMMCIQRYVCVCYPFSARLYYSTRRTIAIVVSSFLLAFIVHFHLLIFLVNKTEDVILMTVENPNSTYTAVSCSWGLDITKTHSTVHNAIYIIFVELLPCTIITIMTITIIRRLRESQKFREKSTRNDEDLRHHKAESRQTTLMLVGIMVIFLVTEIPFVVLLLLITTRRYVEHFLTTNQLYIMAVIQTLVVLLNCHMNFWIYCTMSKSFRRSMKKIFLCEKEDEPELNTSTTTA